MDSSRCTQCSAPIEETQASLSSMRRDGARPTCADCCTAELTRAREQAEQDAEPRDEAYERAAARARGNDFADTGGKDWT